MATHKVTLNPSGKVVEVEENKPLLESLVKAGVYIKSSCGGVGNCSDCMVKVTEGKDYLNSLSFEETQLLGNVFHITKERLSCQVKISGDITLDITHHDKLMDEFKSQNKNIKRRTTPVSEKATRDGSDHYEALNKQKKGGLRRPKKFKN